MNEWTVPGYTESRELGAGGSGRVVLAVHNATGTWVAVKYLGNEISGDQEFVRAFRGEAQLLADLDSPHVVRLYEYIEAPQGAALVMELVDGVALRALLRQEGATGPEAALTVLKGSLLGLAAAHRAGVVHRDYKPENVLVAADGSTKLADFGIAVRSGASADAAGTPSYMAPEQWRGDSASPAGDVYAATATFYECLTGRKPFAAGSTAELAVAHTTAPIPEEGAPEPVRPLIRQGLAKDPAHRPRDAAAFVEELETLACAAYGEDWEERGQRRLAALAALLPLLFPSAAGVPESMTKQITTLPEGSGAGGGWWGAGKTGWLVGASLLAVGGLLAANAVADGGGQQHAAAQTSATTSADPAGSPLGPPGEAGATPSSTGSPSGSASPTASPSGSYTTPGPEGSPTPGPPSGPSSYTAPAPGGGTPSGDPPASASPTGPTAPVSTPTEPSPSASTVDPAKVTSLTVQKLTRTGTAGAKVAVDVTTSGPGPVQMTVAWYVSKERGVRGTPDGAARTLVLRGSTRYSLDPSHTFQNPRGGCYWGVAVSTSPTAPQGDAFRQIPAAWCYVQ